jgi:tetratricopeptide (TPR) repeat protein
MILRRATLFLLAAILLPAALPAQTERPDASREIRGRVLASATGQPIPGAVVSLESSVGDVLQQQSADGGYFQFLYLGGGIFYVAARAPGFREQKQRVDLVTLRQANLQFLLLSDAQPNAAPPPSGLANPEYLKIPEKARKEFERGSRLFREKKLGASIDALRKAIALHDAFPQAHLLLGTIYLEQQKWKEAQASLEKAASLDDKEAGAFLALGACLAQQGKFAEAEAPLKRGLEMHPDTADGHVELGKVYWALGRPAEAEPHARRAIELRPENSLAHLLLGNVLLRKRDPRGALHEFQEYLRLDPQGPFAAETREVVKKIEQALAASRPQ